MPKRVLTVNWKAIDGAAVKKRILHLKAGDDGLFLCPIQDCLHVPYKSNRGLRKHINNTHPWYYYFDQQPAINRREVAQQVEKKLKASTHKMPSFSLNDGVGLQFLEWLQTPCGGGKSIKEAIQIGRRGMKFLMASMGDPDGEQKVKEEYIDCCVGSPTIVMAFLKVLTEDWDIGMSGALGYMKAISDLMDFRKSNGVSDDVLRTFAVTEVYIRRGKENLAKEKKIEYARNLDLETLIARNSWATIEEMQTVIPYHTPKYEYVLRQCNSGERPPSASELSFATRYIVTFLFLRVKCTRPMTYQFMTLEMVTAAKQNGGYIDQTAFKTHDKYVFDTLVLTKDVSDILDTYITVVRPLLNPSCDYVLVTNNGTQYHALGTAMSLLVLQAIGKSVNPTRYRQIVESQSATQLSSTDRETISRDQKHSSQVAKRIYQKRLSREVAVEGRTCMQKMVGMGGEHHTSLLANTLRKTLPGRKDGECSASNTRSVLPQPHDGNYEMPCDIGDHVSNALVAGDNDIPCVTRAEVVESDTEPMDIVTTENIVHVVEDEQCTITALSPQGVPDSSSTDSQIRTTIVQSTTVPPHADKSVAVKDNGVRDTPSCSVSVNGTENSIDHGKGVTETQTDDIDVKKEDVEIELARGTRLMRFTIEEDSFLRQGVQKYGKGKWSHILKDKDLKFHPSRTRDSLRMRADTIGVSGKKKRVRKVYDMR